MIFGKNDPLTMLRDFWERARGVGGAGNNEGIVTSGAGGAANQVEGKIATGAAAGATKGVIVAGVDAAGNVRRILVNDISQLLIGGIIKDGDTEFAYPVLMGGEYQSGAGGFTMKVLQANASGELIVATGNPGMGAPAGLEASKVFSAAPQILCGFWAFNNSGQDRWLLIFNEIAVPANGAATKPYLPPFLVRPGETISVPLFDRLFFSTGISVMNSTDPTTITLGGADFMFRAQLKPL